MKITIIYILYTFLVTGALRRLFFQQKDFKFFKYLLELIHLIALIEKNFYLNFNIQKFISIDLN